MYKNWIFLVKKQFAICVIVFILKLIQSKMAFSQMGLSH